VDLSKFKLDVYDFLGIILPGLVAVAAGWVFLRGWAAFIQSMSNIKGTSLTLLLVFAFGIGHLVQELSDAAIRWAKGSRYIYRGRDSFWHGEESNAVKSLIKKQVGHELTNVDDAYDFCLTKIHGRFEKRDIFIATADLSRSFVAMCFLALAPAAKIAFWQVSPICRSIDLALGELAILAIIALLSWRRMMRYRELADRTVFRVYAAVATEHNGEQKGNNV